MLMRHGFIIIYARFFAAKNKTTVLKYDNLSREKITICIMLDLNIRSR